MAAHHSFLALAPPAAPQGPWRCKTVGPRRVVELDHANDAGSRARTPAPPTTPPPGRSALPPTCPRAKAMRLARMTPELMRRFDEVHYDESASSVAMRGSSLGPLRPLGCRTTVCRELSDLVDPLERDNFLEGPSMHQRNHILLAPVGLGGSGPLMSSAAELQDLRRQLAEAQFHGAELLEALRRQSTKTRFAMPAALMARLLGNEDICACHVVFLAWSRGIAQSQKVEAAEQIAKANEAVRSTLAEAMTRDIAAAARLTEARLDAAARLAAIEGEMERRMAEQAAHLQQARQRTKVHCEHAVEVENTRVASLAVLAWRADVLQSRAQEKLETERAKVAAVRLQQLASAEDAAACKAAATAAQARAAELEVRQRRAEARMAELEFHLATAGLASDGQTGSTKASTPWKRMICDSRVWGNTALRSSMLGMVLAWRMAVNARRACGTLQSKLFAEEAYRSAALDAQKRELDTRIMEAEAQHREVEHSLRADLAAAEARHADAIALRDSEATQRMAAAEADFMAALREAVRRPIQNGEVNETMDAAGTEASYVGRPADINAPVTQAETDARVANAIRSLRARAEVRIVELEARQAETLSAERERSTQLMAEAEKQHTETLRRMQEASDRRIIDAEVRHMEALRELQDASDRRILDLEARHARTVAVLQDTLYDELGYEGLSELIASFPPSQDCWSRGSVESRGSDPGL
mmetsp:Transcript_84253/g.235094  ORF Transcript_84253/g.235094 Transcript_84253/m.235094 type:complete len:705 (-) Transcript_84253:203-2317(-)